MSIRRLDVPVENVAEIVWGVLVLVYLIGSGHPDYLRPSVVVVFACCAGAALLEVYLRNRRWPWLLHYDILVWTVLLTAMVAVTGGRGSELWPAYILMSLTAPSVKYGWLPYVLVGTNSLLYFVVYIIHNPFAVDFDLTLLVMRIGMIFLVTYVVDQSMGRERAALQQSVEVVQSRVAELVGTRDAERKRIANEIHDWLGSGIVAPIRSLELAQRAPETGQMKAHIDEAISSLQRSYDELRRVMENLHPYLLEQMGLSHALQSYLKQWGEEHHIETKFHEQVGLEPDPEMALSLFRILQEALNNCAKHSQATEVNVRLILSPLSVTLMVSDNGTGTVNPRPGGRGLTVMGERTSGFGGSLRVSAKPGLGTTIIAELPVPTVGKI